jgi:hypothetical protein
LSECRSGWYDAWPLRTLPGLPGRTASRDVAVRLSANADALLVRTNVATSNDTGFAFFGQSVRYNTYGPSSWQRLRRVPPDSVAFHIDPPALPGDPPTATAARPTLLSRAESLRKLERHVRQTLPRGAKLSILREVRFEPAAFALPRERMLVEVSATYDGNADDDPFPVVLAGDRRVADVEVQRREQLGARSYVLLRLTYDLVP